jgi:hypothetical protein
VASERDLLLREQLKALRRWLSQKAVLVVKIVRLMSSESSETP